MGVFAAMVAGSEKPEVMTSLWAALVVLLVILLQPYPAKAEPAKHLAHAAASPPSQYGKVIFRENSERQDHIFIVAQNHRSALTGTGNEDTEKVQAEIYRIGEWLIRNNQVELLLPEGYFDRPATDSRPRPAMVASRAYPAATGRHLDDRSLLAKLADRSRFVNADLLLHLGYGVELRQIEDRDLFFIVTDLLRSLEPEPASLDKTKLDYYQKKRSAVILQKIPDIMDREFGTETVPRRAMLTIGLAHLSDMIRFLNNGETTVDAPSLSNDDCRSYTCDLKRLKEQYAITIIVPRTLAEREMAMELVQVREP